ncbi:hypothetical protein [Oribacterium sp. WCC10]|uniref:hypothetical protein n=1 Tax=Oribacterium sp. WCC10 TaxID=1855343 RepID=UPI0008DEBE73|nr:hypothetical protein [Oribacterium sp. WCC10]SFG24557.1 flagellar hook-associated protein 3 FlgL [Oribacterium sp. WCC10]
MRVTSSSFYKDYAQSVQDQKYKYNKSMEQVQTGRKYDTAAESPLDYYAGKKIDNLYNDAVTKDTMIKDVMNRMEQQEAASRTLYSQMGDLNIKYEQMASASFQGLESTVDTMHTYMLNAQQTMTQDLNTTYENYYVMGGNDGTTVPFTMSDDGYTLTYHHKFAGDDAETTMNLKYNPTNKVFEYSGTDKNGQPMDEDATLKKIVTAMREQGRMSLGYGDITNVRTLPDTYYGGLNMITGVTSDQLRDQDTETLSPNLDANIATFREAMNKSGFALNARAIAATDKYTKSFSDGSTEDQRAAVCEEMNADLAHILQNWDSAMNSVSNTFRRIGVATATLEDVQYRLQTAQDSYIEEYNDHMAIDTYDAIVKMYQNQFSYNAAMQVGSKIMQNSLFDFVH